MIPPDELLAMASQFDVGTFPVIMGKPEWWLRYPEDTSKYRIYACRKAQSDGTVLWAIEGRYERDYLNKDGKWEYGGLPSSRDDEFIARCRYASAEEAINYARRWRETVLDWAKSQIAAGQEFVNEENCPEVSFVELNRTLQPA